MRSRRRPPGSGFSKCVRGPRAESGVIVIVGVRPSGWAAWWACSKLNVTAYGDVGRRILLRSEECSEYHLDKMTPGKITSRLWSYATAGHVPNRRQRRPWRHQLGLGLRCITW